MRSTRLLLTLIALGALTAPAAAFDGHRKGFFLAVGLGGGPLSSDQEWSLLGEQFALDQSASGATLNLKIGYGLSDQLLLSYSTTGTTASMETIDGQIAGTPDEQDANFTIGGFGLTYYFSAAAPSPFVDLTLGVSSWDDGESSFSGGGASIGAGLEFKKNWTAEFDFSFGAPSDKERVFGEIVSADMTGTSFAFTLNHIWY
jgi:hypothetical protein